ncbi:MAG: hypothetical protein K9G76_06330 [Bacteroidales bacterium]|nr:hypothetical protein [Bacteroidales bacterium]MCF8402354.1 hypothetical protein [Bacteroidales bacterium]
MKTILRYIIGINVALGFAIPLQSLAFMQNDWSTGNELEDGTDRINQNYLSVPLSGTSSNMNPVFDNEDYGDAPEGPAAGYPTTLTNNGARHNIVPGIFLGLMVDAEPDGQPSMNADCDDTDCLFPSFGDDEDGIILPGSVSPGATINFTAIASVDGYLDAWMDFNLVNAWTDPGEHIINTMPLTSGSNTLSFTVPSSATIGQSFLRFRFRDFDGPISFDGLVDNGEVEDYSISIEAATPVFDFGDAPENPAGSYPTTLSANGARHTVVPGIFLGNLIDKELDGQASTGANCDDNNCLFPGSGDDEDGVNMPVWVNKGSLINLSIVASVNGYLDAWFDFNRNNSWSDAGEHLFSTQQLSAGINVLTLLVPTDAEAGLTYARFRFRDFDSPISYEGLVANGEVEDYAFTIVSGEPEFDFGDAPESIYGEYPTSLAFNGARHQVVPGIFLGSMVDAEPDGQPGSNANCDDQDCIFPSLGDDEDGVSLPGLLPQGSTQFMTVTASVDGFLDVWMDFNGNSSWADAGDHIKSNYALTAGLNNISFFVPVDATIGWAYVRFRFRDFSGSISYDGLVQNGEVEDYRIQIVEGTTEYFDFGDAPESPDGGYPTILASNGARHTIVPGIWLGGLADEEPDGQPGPGADCDDTDCFFTSMGDDEDGVILPSWVVKGSVINLTVTASVDGYLDVWMDFDRNSSWADAGEHIFIIEPLISGPNVLSLSIPATADTGLTYMRFRFRDNNSPLNFDGYATNGEVEDFAIQIIESNPVFDFGDAPENAVGNYPTTLAFNGARHIFDPTIFLGSFVDPEPNGQPGINADCDDLDCLFPSLGDDEDGVTWAGPVSPGATVPVTVMASVDGYLDGWMDFNLDQDWDDADEHVFTSTFVVAGPNLLNITIPATADTGQSFVRFRFRDYGGALNYDGLAQNGEVEDYGIHIVHSNIKLDVNVILGGAVLPGWNPGNPAIMDTSLNVLGYLPLTQPYNDPAAIWYYNGSEQVPVMNKADIVDWVKIELRETANGPSTATAATIIAEQAVFLLNDGTLVSLDGTTMPTSSVIPKVDVYLVIWHRNHLAIMSANPMTNLGGGVFSYDFTSGPNQAYGSNAQIQIAPGYYGMIPADAEPDGTVDAIDYAIWRSYAGATGYQGEDMNLDGQVDNVDKNDLWTPNNGSGVQIP